MPPVRRIPNRRLYTAVLTLGALALLAPAPVALAQMHSHGNGAQQSGGHGMGNGTGNGPNNGMGHRHGADGTGHDEVTMPGLRGANASPEESAELAVMFRNFQTFSREVTNLPDGIRTVTRSSHPEVMELLVSHVTGMIGRVETGADPQVLIQSPTLDIFFARHEEIETTVDITEAGIVVTQTSSSPEIVAALQTHAAEVSDMAARGMQAVHERMMAQN